MKIAHIADIHIGLGYPGPTLAARFDDIVRVMDWAADRMIAEQVDLVLVAGDLFRKADIALDKASKEIRAATAWLRKLTAAGIEVIVISGTPSHDPISAYELLKDYGLSHVRTTTQPVMLLREDVKICCLPGMDRSTFATADDYRGQPAHIIHQAMTDYITETCQALRSQAEASGEKGPTILLGHLSFDLADKGFEDVLMQQEAILTTEAIEGYDLVALGHIHRPQQNGNVFYCGSPERLSFNDEGIDAGFWIHEWDGDTGKQLPSRFIDTPARIYSTIKWPEDHLAAFIAGATFEPESMDGQIVRLHYTCSEGLNKQLNRRTLERALYDAGAFFVAEIKGDIERTDRARDSEVTEALGPVEALRRWGENQAIPATEIDELAAMTTQLMGVA